MNPFLITPPHEVRDAAKLAQLVESMRRDGWTGRPVVIVDTGTWQAITGSHRIEAARILGIDVPTVEADESLWEEYTQRGLDDTDRLRIATAAGDVNVVALIRDEIRANQIADSIADRITTVSANRTINKFDEMARLFAETLATGDHERDLYVALMQAFRYGATPAGSSGSTTSGNFDFAALKYAANHGGDLITKIKETTRSAVSLELQRAIDDGLSPNEFQEKLQESFGFSRDRALMIARDQTVKAYNVGEATSWESSGTNFVRAIDGTSDPECKHANGLVVTIAEYKAKPNAHPNCVRSAEPLPFDYHTDSPGHFID